MSKLPREKILGADERTKDDIDFGYVDVEVVGEGVGSGSGKGSDSSRGGSGSIGSGDSSGRGGSGRIGSGSGSNFSSVCVENAVYAYVNGSADVVEMRKMDSQSLNKDNESQREPTNVKKLKGMLTG